MLVVQSVSLFVLSPFFFASLLHINFIKGSLHAQRSMGAMLILKIIVETLAMNQKESLKGNGKHEILLV